MQSKALGTLLVTLGVAAVSSAQVAFQVAGPQNGATVRETVKIRIPRTALEGVKYLALGVDGKFRAGVMVPAPGQKVDTDFIVSDGKPLSMVTLLYQRVVSLSTRMACMSPATFLTRMFSKAAGVPT